MASEYLKWKYRDVKPEQERELTPAEKRKNWWDYHKWHVVVGVLVLLLLLDLGRSILHIGEIQPDVQAAYVGQAALPEQTVAALEEALAALAQDANGDGRTVVRLNQYSVFTDPSADPNFAAAEQVRLMGDLQNCDSAIFLLEDPALFQTQYGVLCFPDGRLPPEEGPVPEGLWLAWTDCPVLRELELGTYEYDVMGQTFTGENRTLLEGLSVARRGFWTDRTAKNPEACAALWEAITAGAEEP